MISIELDDLDPQEAFDDVTVDMLPDRLKPYVIEGTVCLRRIKHRIEAGVITQLWERELYTSDRVRELHRFTLRFPASEQ